MQLLALGAAVEIVVSSDDEGPQPIAVPRLYRLKSDQLRELGRSGQTVNEVAYRILWAERLGQSEGDLQDESKFVRNTGGRNTHSRDVFCFKHRWRSVIYGYGANRRRAPKGLTSEVSDDPTQTLFDDDATLRNPEEWLLQNELVANTSSPLQGRAERQRDRVIEIVQAAPDANLVVLRRQPDGVVIDNAPRSVRKWRVDQILTSELFDIPSARAPELDALIRERDDILAKPRLSTEDERRLAEIRSQLEDLPHGDTPEDIEAMEVIRRAAKALKDQSGQ